MKNHFLYLFAILLIVTISSCTKTGSALVVKDCTGSYLKLKEKDYLICNSETVNDFNNGDSINVVFKTAKKCLTDTLVRCKMFHANEGWINVTEVKKVISTKAEPFQKAY